MKEGEGRLSQEAKKLYLQELRDRLVPTNDESLVRMIRNLLLNVEDTVPSITLAVPVNAEVAAEGEAVPGRKESGTKKDGIAQAKETQEKSDKEEETHTQTGQNPVKGGDLQEEVMGKRDCPMENQSSGQEEAVAGGAGSALSSMRLQDTSETPSTSSSSDDDDSVSSSSSDSSSGTSSSSSSDSTSTSNTEK
jgi:hypothetical protein